jgi:hypothetical protein
MEAGHGPPHFVISGQNYHRIGSLIPKPGEIPKFAQLYIYDTQNELSNRFSHFRLDYLFYHFFSIMLNSKIVIKQLFFLL